MSSLLLAVLLVWLFYAPLVSIMVPLGTIATTAIVMTVVFVWGLGWIGFELLWEWRAGRGPAS